MGEAGRRPGKVSRIEASFGPSVQPDASFIKPEESYGDCGNDSAHAITYQRWFKIPALRDLGAAARTVSM